MFGWFAFHWLEVSFGFFYGAMFSLVRKLWLSFLFSTGLFFAIYLMMVGAVAHAGARWDNQVAIAGVLGCALGCFVCPMLDLLYGVRKPWW
jgi:hypothetical protein